MIPARIFTRIRVAGRSLTSGAAVFILACSGGTLGSIEDASSGGVSLDEGKSGDDAESPEDASSSQSADLDTSHGSDATDESGGGSGTADDDDDDDDDDDSEPKFDLGPIPDFEAEPRNCNIDFLFVIDNSGSMADEQQNLASSVPEFVKTVTEEIPELGAYHVGVITTDDNRFNSAGCNRLGGLVTQTFGADSSNQLCGPYANGRNFMTRADDLGSKFSCAARPGTGGSGNERAFDALQAALSPSLTGPGACNEGFLRDDAVLVVTIISDEEDDHADQDPGGQSGSSGEPSEWFAAVMAAKRNRPEYVVALSLIGIEEPNACSVTHQPGTGGVDVDGAEISLRIKSFTEMFGTRGKIGDVCADNYDPFFEQAVSVIELACDQLPEG